MNRIEIPEAGIVRDVPASFDEMSRRQVLRIMKNLDALRAGRMTVAEFRLRALFALVGVRRTVRDVVQDLLHPEATRLRNERIALLAERLCGFLLEDRGGALHPVYDTATNHLPVLWIRGRRFVGPADGLLDLSFGELVAADAELALYVADGDESHVDNLIATLYRPRGPRQPCGRHVEAFDEERTERIARHIRRLAPWKKQTIMLWYAACIDRLQHGSYILSGREASFEPLFSGEASSGKSLGWLGTLFDLASRRIFGDIRQTAEANIIDVLALLLNYKYQSDHAAKPPKTH